MWGQGQIDLCCKTQPEVDHAANESPWRVWEDGATQAELTWEFCYDKRSEGREGRKRKKRPLQKSNGKESRNRRSLSLLHLTEYIMT